MVGKGLLNVFAPILTYNHLLSKLCNFLFTVLIQLLSMVIMDSNVNNEHIMSDIQHECEGDLMNSIVNVNERINGNEC